MTRKSGDHLYDNKTPDEIMKGVGERLTLLCESNNVSKEVLASLLDVSVDAVLKMMNGDSRIKQEYYVAMEKQLGFDIHYLITGELEGNIEIVRLFNSSNDERRKLILEQYYTLIKMRMLKKHEV